ncbi:hypothetical protein JCM16358_19060 [Halanaerocella petrolearia]
MEGNDLNPFEDTILVAIVIILVTIIYTVLGGDLESLLSKLV